MEKREQLNTLESRQLELQAIMASSDAHAAKCVKLGKKFSTQYPKEFEAYEAANEEYNQNESVIAELKAELASEEAEQDLSEPEDIPGAEE